MFVLSHQVFWYCYGSSGKLIHKASDNIDFKAKNMKCDRNEHFVRMNNRVHQRKYNIFNQTSTEQNVYSKIAQKMIKLHQMVGREYSSLRMWQLKLIKT